MAAYYSVLSLDEWKARLSTINRRVGQLRRQIQQVVALEKRAGVAGGGDWPVDERAAEFMVCRDTTTYAVDGPFQDFDDEIDVVLADSYRYQFVITPRRPADNHCLGISFHSVTASHSIMQILAGDGTPFSAVHCDATHGDKVNISFKTDLTTALYENVQCETLIDGGRGVLLEAGALEHLNDCGFGSSEYWECESEWSISGGTATATFVADTGDLVQHECSMVQPMVAAGRYRVEISVESVAGTPVITPRIGDTTSFVDGPVISQNGNYAFYLTTHSDAVYNDFALVTTFDVGDEIVVNWVHITAVYWEHVENCRWVRDPTTGANGYMYADGVYCWTPVLGWGGPNQFAWSDPGLSCTLVSDTLTQNAEALAIPFTSGLKYKVRIIITQTAGTVRVAIGSAGAYNYGPELSSSGTHEFYIYALLDPVNHLVIHCEDFSGTITQLNVFHDDEDANGLPTVTLSQSWEDV